MQQSQKYTIFLFLLLVGLTVKPVSAIQPAFINGTIYNAFNNSLVSSAVIHTTTGLQTTVTNGTFTLRIPPNMYNLIVSSPGFRTNMLTGILASPGQTTTVSIWLYPASTPAGTLTGRVVDAETNEGFYNAFVATDLGAITLTDDDGYFSFDTPSGSATVTVFCEGYSSRVFNSVSIDSYRTTRLYAALRKAPDEEVKVSGHIINACSAANVTGVRVHSSTGDITISNDGFFSIESGTGLTTLLFSSETFQFGYETISLLSFPPVTAADFELHPARNGCGLLQGVITDALTGKPVSGADILADTGMKSAGQINGTYNLYGSICTSTITVSKKGYETATVPVTLLYNASTAANIALNPLADLSGIIYDASDNHTISGATIVLDGDTTLSTSSASDGSFYIADIEPGEHTLEVGHACYEIEEKSFSIDYGDLLNTTVSLSTDHHTTVSGTVVDSTGSAPIAGVRVRADHGATALTDTSGRYSMSVPSCPSRITFSADGYLTASQRIAPDETIGELEINIRLVSCPVTLLAETGTDSGTDVVSALAYLRSLRDGVFQESTLLSKYSSSLYLYAHEITKIIKTDPSIRAKLSAVLHQFLTDNAEYTPNSSVRVSKELIDALLQSSTRMENHDISTDLKTTLRNFTEQLESGSLFASDGITVE